MAIWEGGNLARSPQLLRLPAGESGTVVLVWVLSFPNGEFFWSGGSVVPLEVRPLYGVDGGTFVGEPAIEARGPKSLLRFDFELQGVKLCARTDALRIRVEVVPIGSPLTIDGSPFTIDGEPLIV